MDLTFEQWVEVVYEFLKGENTNLISKKLNILEKDLIEFEKMFLAINNVVDAEECFGDILIVIGEDMINKGYDAEFILWSVQNSFKVSKEIAEKVLFYENLVQL